MSAASTVTVWQLGTGEAETATAQQMQGAAYMLLRQLATLLRCYVAVSLAFGSGTEAWLRRCSQPATAKDAAGEAQHTNNMAGTSCRKHATPSCGARALQETHAACAAAAASCTACRKPPGPYASSHPAPVPIVCLHACQTVPVQLVYTSATPACFPQKTLPLLRRPAGLCATSCT